MKSNKPLTPGAWLKEKKRMQELLKDHYLAVDICQQFGDLIIYLKEDEHINDEVILRIKKAGYPHISGIQHLRNSNQTEIRFEK